MATRVIMPQLGESVVEGTVTRWLKSEGDEVQELEALLEVNTDKVDTEIPSPAAGKVLKILVPEGETVRAGTVIAWIGDPGEQVAGQDGPGGGAAAPARPEDRAPEAGEQGAGKPAEAIQETAAEPPSGEAGREEDGQKGPAAGRSRELGFISPIVARLAQEHNLDLRQIEGTGEGGRITKKDVLAYLERGAGPAKAAAPAGEQPPAPWETPGEGDLFRPTEMVFKQPPGKPAPDIQPAQPEPGPTAGVTGEGHILPLSSMRRQIAEHMVVSKRTAPHVTTVMEADLHRVVAHYNANKEAFARDGAKLTYTAYFVAAAVEALRAFPRVNASWTDEGILVHPRMNIGLAVSLGEEGLIVPVIKGADSLSLLGLARAIEDLADRARRRQLRPEEVKDGTFTITNHGVTGSLFATPVIHQPQSAILGVGAIQKRVVVTPEDAIAIRPMVYLSLSFDHRVLDGASADGFLAQVVQALEKWT